jgi:hypothetical protein
VLRGVPGYERTVFINRNADKPHLFVFGHEFTHALRNASQVAYNTLEKVVLDSSPLSKEVAELKKIGQNASPTVEQLTRVEEYVADHVGERMLSPRFWDLLEAEYTRTTPKREPFRQYESRTAPKQRAGVQSGLLEADVLKPSPRPTTSTHILEPIVRIARRLLNKILGTSYDSTNAKDKDFQRIDDQLVTIFSDLAHGALDFAEPADAEMDLSERGLKLRPGATEAADLSVLTQQSSPERQEGEALDLKQRAIYADYNTPIDAPTAQVLWSVVPAQSNLREWLESDDLIIGPLKDPSPSLYKTTKEWVTLNRRIPVSRWMLAVRTLAATSAAPQEAAY